MLCGKHNAALLGPSHAGRRPAVGGGAPAPHFDKDQGGVRCAHDQVNLAAPAARGSIIAHQQAQTLALQKGQRRILTRIAGLSAWWTLPLLLVIPFLKAHDKAPKLLCLALLAIWWIWLCQRIAKRFGKGVGFGLGLAVPGTDFYVRTALAFDKSTYNQQP